MIRNLLPTDLATLLLLNGKVLPNEARTREELGEKGGSSIPLRALLEQCFPVRQKRHALISVERGRMQGLISTRCRSGPGAWEIDCLLLASGEESVYLGLMERMSLHWAKHEVGKVFLRLSLQSPLVSLSQQTGFSHYLTEFLYKSEEGLDTEAVCPAPALRPRASEDEYGLFRLYSAAVPASVRSVEGMTFGEWQESRESGSKREFILEQEGNLFGWLRILKERGEGRFDLIAHPSAEDSLEPLIQSGIALLGGKRPLFCLASEFQERVRYLLEGQNFEEVAGYALLVKQPAARVHQPELMPMQA